MIICIVFLTIYCYIYCEECIIQISSVHSNSTFSFDWESIRMSFLRLVFDRGRISSIGIMFEAMTYSKILGKLSTNFFALYDTRCASVVHIIVSVRFSFFYWLSCTTNITIPHNAVTKVAETGMNFVQLHRQGFRYYSKLKVHRLPNIHHRDINFNSLSQKLAIQCHRSIYYSWINKLPLFSVIPLTKFEVSIFRRYE